MDCTVQPRYLHLQADVNLPIKLASMAKCVRLHCFHKTKWRHFITSEQMKLSVIYECSQTEGTTTAHFNLCS